MFLFVFLACGVVCRSPEPDLSCSASAMDPNRQPITDPTDPIRGWFGIQGGAHIEVALDLMGTSPDLDVGVEILLADDTVVSRYGPFPMMVEVADRDTCASETTRLEVPFESGEDICDVDGQELRLVVTVTRRDGQAATCETAGILVAEDTAISVFCPPET